MSKQELLGPIWLQNEPKIIYTKIRTFLYGFFSV